VSAFGRAPAFVELLEAQQAAPFPEACRGRGVADVPLAALDAEVVELASAYLAHRRLGDAQRLILEGCLADAERVLPLLGGEARAYFARLHEIAAAVLHAADAPAPEPGT
jgi:hypothetical protein